MKVKKKYKAQICIHACICMYVYLEIGECGKALGALACEIGGGAQRQRRQVHLFVRKQTHHLVKPYDSNNNHMLSSGANVQMNTAI